MSRETRFLKACRRELVDCTPVWLMRQAGRYMKEYRDIKEKMSFLEMCKNPEVAAEVTLQPVNKIGVDAAILFADILLPVEAMGMELEFAKGHGPVLHNPVREQAHVERLEVIEPEEKVPYVMEAIKIVKTKLKGQVPLIGFSGAPFTLASYMIEGGHSRNYIDTKRMMYHQPKTFHLLMNKISEVVTSYLKAQIEAGAQAVQVFDTWVECLSPTDYKKYVLPHSKRIFEELESEEVPVIHFARGGATLLELMKEAKSDVIGVDWRIDLDVAWERMGYDIGIQGNLDPVVLFAPPDEIDKRVKDILDRAEGRPGHIFNLGHGVLPKTPVENVKVLVDAVHKYSKK